MDEITFWDIPLSQEEVLQYMNCSPAGNEEGLVGYWNFVWHVYVLRLTDQQVPESIIGDKQLNCENDNIV